MRTEFVKGSFNEREWVNRSKFTKPNGHFESNLDEEMTFVPKMLPPSIYFDNELIMLLAEAERKVGELKGIGSELPNPHLLIRSYLKREAVLSSKIEGTLASIGDLKKYEAVGNISKKDAERLRLREVLNYVDTLESCLDAIREKRKRIDLNMIKTAHKTLLEGVRGSARNPGEFRKKQNYIVKGEGAYKRIIYTPPPPEKVLELLQNLARFIQGSQKNVPVLIQCAIMHYQFEAIHPFGDGNGRIGRLLIPLILFEKDLLQQPLLYLSAYFDKYNESYYDGLMAVSQKSKWREWIKFFLKAFADQSDETVKNIQRLLKLQRKYKNMLRNRKFTSSNVIILMEQLFANPYITIPRAQEYLGVSYPAAKNAVMKLVKVRILKQTDIVFSSKVFLAKEIEDNLRVE